MMKSMAIMMIATFSTATSSAAPMPRPIRVRVSQALAKTASLSGSEITIEGRTFFGYRAFKLKRGGPNQVWTVVDRDTNRLIATTQSLHINGTDLRFNLKPVPRDLVIERSNVIAQMDIEEYLRGVLPAEMPATWPMQALKAQAIAARTFALYRANQRADETYDVESDVMDQMFAQDTPTTANANEAIASTRGVVLRDHKQNVFAAYFHADCGGHTEEARDVWGGGERLGTTGCAFNPNAQWSLKLTREQLARKLGLSLDRILVKSHTASGRVASLQLNDVETMSGTLFRQKLGFNELKSTQFTVSKRDDVFIFTGQGHGHGVGLCQWGARAMAKEGRDYKEILRRYYPRALLVDRDPNLNSEKDNGANDKKIAEFH